MDARDQLFDARLALLRRGRAARAGCDASFLHRRAADELLDRLDLVARPFTKAFNLGADIYLGQRMRARGLDVAGGGEECLPALAAGSLDLVVSVGLLDTINDLPGALALIRRALRPDGLFLAAFAGAGSLARLRQAMRAGEEAECLGPSPRIHPQIDVRAAGDLLVRAGFALPVVDRDVVEVRYRALDALVADLRAMAATNILARRSRRPFTRKGVAAAAAAFGTATLEKFEIVYLSGWAPAPGQPVAARRGSATASLADALKPRSR